MKAISIHWKQASELLNQGEILDGKEIIFDSQVPLEFVITFNRANISVPENLISDDDSSIDTTDIPEISSEDIRKGKLVRDLPSHVKIDPETENRLKKSNINYNELLSNLSNNFYQSIKTLPSKAAF